MTNHPTVNKGAAGRAEGQQDPQNQDNNVPDKKCLKSVIWIIVGCVLAVAGLATGGFFLWQCKDGGRTGMYWLVVKETLSSGQCAIVL